MYSLVSFYLLSLVVLSNGFGRMGPVGYIDIDFVDICDDREYSEGIQAESALVYDSKGTKSWSCNTSILFDVDDKLEYKFNLKKWTDGWQHHFDHTGKLCPDMMKYAQKLWQNFRDATTPEPPPSCSLSAGNYTVVNFQSDAKDFGVPSIFYGRMRAEVDLIKDGNLVVCLCVEFDSRSPT